ncbi:cytochrome P450 4c3-like [Pararge aegeria]|uniref:cytochrome P450 4c3-like n=1 Tax=Pararge aegeria TaxID=116150 RepID=UPI0019D06BB7|nr:cytochrome P450 4c3-like [Pararge aegeria]
MSSSEFLPKSDTYKFLAPWLGNSLLLSSGKEWYHRRKLLTKAFHFNILKKFMDTFNTETEHFIKQVEKETLEEHTDLFAIVGPVALRVISETAMGISLGDEEVAFDKYFQSILAMGECFISRVSKLWLHNDFLFNLSKIARVQQCLLKHLHGFTEKVIEDRRQLMREPRFKQVESSPPSNDRHSKMVLIDLLLENEKSGLLDSEGIREEVDTFMFAGYDTTAITMSFFLMAIANEPDIQDKIYEELRQVIGDSQRLPTMQELNELRYLECCIKESLRLYPSVPFIGRKLTKETVLSGYTVPANTTCFIMIYDLHRRADIYPDPERFDPDRFLPENISKRHIYSYLPFSAGLRNCIGQKFAMLEMKMVLSGLLQRFRLEPVTRPSDIVFRADIVLRTSNPIYVRFRSRN